MPPIKQLLANGDVAVIQEDGSHILIDPDGNVKTEEAKTIPGKISSLVSEVSKVRPPVLPGDVSMRNLTPSVLPDEFLSQPAPIATLEKAGQKVSGAVSSIGKDLVKSSVGTGVSGPGEAARLVGGSLINLAGKAGELSPSNVAANIGAHAILAPSGEGGFIRGSDKAALLRGQIVQSPAVVKNVGKALNQALSDFESSIGRKATPEEAGKIIQDTFNKLYAPQEAAATTENTAKQKGFEKAGQYVAGKFGDEPLTTQDTGKSVKDKILSTIASSHENANKLYEKLGSQIRDKKPSDLSPAIDFINAIFEQRGLKSGGKGDMISENLLQKSMERQFGTTLAEFNHIREQLGFISAGQLTSSTLSNKTINAYKLMNQIREKLSNPDLTAEDISRIRTDVNRYAYSGIDDPIKNVYKALSGVLTDVIDKSAEEGGYLKISKGARTYYKNLKDFEESDIAKAAQNKDPSQMIDYAVKTPERATRLMDILSPQGQDDFRNGFLNKIHEAATDAQGDIQPKAVVRGLNKYSDEQLKAVFGDRFSTVDAYRKYSDALSKSDFFSEPQAAETAKTVRESAPSEVLDKVMGKPVETLREVMGNLDDKGQSSLKRGVWDQIIRNSTGADNQLDWGKLGNNINRFNQKNPGWLKELYGPADYKVIAATQRISEAIDKNASSGFGTNIVKAAVYRNPMLRLYFAAKAILPKLGGGLQKETANILSQEGASGMASRFLARPSIAGTSVKAAARLGIVRSPYLLKQENP